MKSFIGLERVRAVHCLRESRCFFRLLGPLGQKKQYSGNVSSKGGSEEKWAQVAMEYIYEANHTSESGKRLKDVQAERRASTAFDRYFQVNEQCTEIRMGRLANRMSEVLETLQKLGLSETLEEATMLNSEQFPTNFRRPSLTPPLPGYEPGFGMDVPQLRAQHMEYPPVNRVTDPLEFSPRSNPFPFVGAHEIEDITLNTKGGLMQQLGELREASPITGVEGEAFAARVALATKALARQTLILDLMSDSTFKDTYDTDEFFRQSELQKRGIVLLTVDSSRDRHEQRHFAHEPAHQPFRQS